MQSTQGLEHPKVLLVSIRTPKVTEGEADESLAELERLVTQTNGHASFTPAIFLHG